MDGNGSEVANYDHGDPQKSNRFINYFLLVLIDPPFFFHPGFYTVSSLSNSPPTTN